jgi:uncharacterized membrane protein YbhN (UPF0104 family)
LIAALSFSTGAIKALPQNWDYILFPVALSGLIISFMLLAIREIPGPIADLIKKTTGKTMDWSFPDREILHVLGIFLLSVGATLSYFISCHCLAIGVGLNSSFLMNSGTISLAGLLTMLPITIMGLGTREVTFLFIFKDYPKSSVLAFSGLVFLVAQIGGAILAFTTGHVCLWISRRRVS